MMHDMIPELERLVSEHAPRLQTGRLLFSQRAAIARAMQRAMSDEMMKIDSERTEFDRERMFCNDEDH